MSGTRQQCRPPKAPGFHNLTGIACSKRGVSGAGWTMCGSSAAAVRSTSHRGRRSGQAVFGHNNLPQQRFGADRDQRLGLAHPAGRRCHFTGARGLLPQTVALGSSIHDIEITDNNFIIATPTRRGGVTWWRRDRIEHTVDYRVVKRTFTRPTPPRSAPATGRRAMCAATSRQRHRLNDGLSDASGSASGNSIAVGLESSRVQRRRLYRHHRRQSGLRREFGFSSVPSPPMVAVPSTRRWSKSTSTAIP